MIGSTFNSRPPLAVVCYFPLCWTTSFSSDVYMLSRVFRLVNMKFFRRAAAKRHVMLELHVAGGEPAHRQAVHQVERKTAGGVMAARQRQNLMRQLHFPEAGEHLPGIHRQESGVVPGPDQEVAHIAALDALQVTGRADH